MPATRPAIVLALCLSGLTLSASDSRRDISFSERVEAQRKLDRLAYSHQIGTRKPFEEAIPWEATENRVRTYLKQSVALQRLWGRRLTMQDLRAEYRRISAGTHMPERWSEQQEALGNDPRLILETLVRPVLVDRLARDRFSTDARIHRRAADRVTGRSWDRWWAVASRQFDERRAATVAAGTVPTSLEAPELEPSLGALEPAPSLDCGNHWEEANPGGNVGQAVWTGTHVLQWSAQQGLKYDPVTDTTTPFPAPSGFFEFASHTLASARIVWTGEEMILYATLEDTLRGDPTIPVMVETSGRYNPLADSWRSMRPSNMTRRKGFTALWTGTEMFITGGETVIEESFPGFFASYFTSNLPGAFYDPENDTWRSGPGLNRTGHVAAHTGDHVLVWGGRCIYAYFNTNPSWPRPANTCGLEDSPGRAINLTTGLSRPVATAAGSYTVVGADGDFLLWGSSGRRYDPVANAWTTFVGGPQPRNGHGAVWSGSEMVVWGGVSMSNVLLRDGGAYDPATNSWHSLPTLGAPSARSNPLMVWMGSGLLVWGGFDAANSPPSGGGRLVGQLDADEDEDGFGRCSGDCDDTSAAIHPGAIDLPGNALDENCDGVVSCDPAGDWRNRGELQTCVAHACKDLEVAGLISKEECKKLVEKSGRIQPKPDPEDPGPEPTPFDP